MTMKHERPVVLVTGAGGGLGKAICNKFHQQGYTVVATDYQQDLLSDFDAKDSYLARTMDVTDSESIRNVVAEIENTYGRLDVVMSCAGILDFGPLSEQDPERTIGIFQVNTFGTLRVVQASLKLLAQSRGRVVCISSESFRVRTPFQAYQVTKNALEGLADTLRRELAYLGVHLATLRPGVFETQMTAKREIHNPAPGGLLAEPFARFAAKVGNPNHKNVASPEVVADAAYLAATDSKKKPHYVVNGMPSMKILSWLPKKMVDRLLLKMLS